MVILSTFVLTLNMLLQAGSVPVFEDDILSPNEKTKLEKASSIERRIKIYTDASKRIQKKIHEAVSKGQFGTVAGDLKLWTALLAKSLEDIETNLEPKKKSRSLIKFEIQVRKSLTDLEDYRLKAPIEQQDLFDACLAQARAVHKKFVEIIFPR